MAFLQGGFLLSNKKLKLPGSLKRAKKDHEEIRVRAPAARTFSSNLHHDGQR